MRLVSYGPMPLPLARQSTEALHDQWAYWCEQERGIRADPDTIGRDWMDLAIARSAQRAIEKEIKGRAA